MRFTWLNLCTIYSCEGTKTHDLRRDVCFHTVIKDTPIKRIMDNEYRIILYSSSSGITEAKNNYCPFSLCTIRNYLRILKKYVAFSYSIKISTIGIVFNNQSTCPCYDLRLHISGGIVKHKFVLKMIRALYEFPYNMYMLDVLRLLKDNKFKKYGLVNLYILIAHFYKWWLGSGSGDQFICDLGSHIIPKFKSIKFWKSKLNNNRLYINGIIPYVSTSDNIRKYIPDLPREKREFCFYDYWKSTDDFQQRVEFYSKIINLYV